MRTSGIVRAYVWLCRIGHCRGFGVQSPWAYSMVRYVINEHFPYYAYKGLRRRYPADAVRRKVGEMLLRLANYAQPTRVAAFYLDDAEEKHSKAYLKAGCRRMDYLTIKKEDEVNVLIEFLQKDVEPHIVITDAQCLKGNVRKSVVDMLRTGDYLFIDNLNARKGLWKDILKDFQNIVSFDMYYCGLIYLDEKRYKQNYIINF